MSIEASETTSGPISARRAYVEVLAVFLAFFGAGIIAAAVDVAGARRTNAAVSWADAAPAAFSALATSGIALALVILLSQRRNRSVADLGLALKGSISLSVGVRMAAWAVLGLLGGSIVTSALASSGYPFRTSNFSYLTYGVFSSVRAGIIEESVVLAFVVVTLRQARRPWPEIVAVALVLRISYHIYYGPGALGVFVWAGVFLWLFRRRHSILPLIAVHVAWDVNGFLSRRWPGVAAAAGVLILALFVTAPILWLVERTQKKHPGPGPLALPPPPGWYPDPTGSGQFRWWDGRAWTGFAGGGQMGPPRPAFGSPP